MSRKIARESVYKLVFEFLFTNNANTATYELLMLDKDLAEDDRQYIKNTYRGIIHDYDELMTYISSFSRGFSAERIVNTDKTALLIAVYEMKNYKDIPMSVSINEAVDIVKRYSTAKSSSFVNGVLASVFKDLQGDKK